MKIDKYISVSASYTRSINIERDRIVTTEDRNYLPTSRAIQTLSRIDSTLHAGSVPRAWALIGPYGSGKSAFGLFLTKLFGVATDAERKPLIDLLRESDSALGDSLANHLQGSHGYCVISLTGSPESLTKRLAQSILEASESFLGGRRGATPKFIREIRSAQSSGEVPIGNLIEWLRELQKAVVRANGRGVLLVVDELGKFLEYEARHRQASDIFLLQALAEHAAASNDAPLAVVVLLHQAFEQYFTSLGETQKNEWKKVQGRFESVPFLESSEQVLRVVRAAISGALPSSAAKQVKLAIGKTVKTLSELNVLPPNMGVQNAKDLFVGCYPLHPISLLLLPVLCQKVAQNERTLFSFLGSTEPHGFQDALRSLGYDESNPNWMMPWQVYEYFILNQPGLISDPVTHRRWAEVITSVERLGDAPESVIRLLKTIGLFNIVGTQGGLKASEELLRLCYEGVASEHLPFEDALRILVEKSIVTFRKFSGEYRVWQGSDFDAEAALQVERDQLTTIELADLLNERGVVAPIVARRHAIETGNLRYFQAVFVDNPLRVEHLALDEPTLLLCLSETRDAEEKFVTALRKLGGYSNIVATIVSNAAMLRTAVTEVLAFDRVFRNSAELSSDPIAKREVSDRQVVAVEGEYELLSAILEEPERSDWWWGGLNHRVETKRALQEVLSHRLDETYFAAPCFQNELINREKPSATAIAARNKLLAAMLESADQNELGFEKFPAEKAMYRSLLLASGVHGEKVNGAWGFQPPADSPVRLGATWHAIEDFLNSTEVAPKTVSELFEMLRHAPFGLKRGVLPVLFLAVYLSYSDEIAIYEDGYYCPFISLEIIERLIKEPQIYSVQRFKIDHIRESLYKAYAESLSLMGDSPAHPNLIAAAKPLAKFMMGLPDYTRKTKKLSVEAQAMRERFYASKSPLQLLFFQIPESLGFRPLVGVETSAELVADFQKKLAAVVGELRVAYHALLNGFLEQIRNIFGLDNRTSLDDVRGILRGRYVGLLEYTIDIQGLKAFIGRISDPFGDESQWLISLASFLARKPPEKWTDDDAVAVEYRLIEFAKRIGDLETLRLHFERSQNRSSDLELVLLKSVSQSRGEVEVVVALDDAKRKVLNSTKIRVMDILSELENDELANALLAILVEEKNHSRPELDSQKRRDSALEDIREGK
jgi:hypothetical protein